jgi:hypothetical protein
LIGVVYAAGACFVAGCLELTLSKAKKVKLFFQLMLANCQLQLRTQFMLNAPHFKFQLALLPSVPFEECFQE